MPAPSPNEAPGDDRPPSPAGNTDGNTHGNTHGTDATGGIGDTGSAVGTVGTGALASAPPGAPDWPRPTGAISRSSSGISRVGVVLAVLGAVGVAPGPSNALLIAGPLSTFALPWLAAVADWGLALPTRRAWMRGRVPAAGLVLAGTAVTTLGVQAGQWGPDPLGLLTGGGRVPGWPCLVPQGALAFVGLIQLSVVSESRSALAAGRPLARWLVLAACFATAALFCATLVDWSAVSPWVSHRDHGTIPALDLLTWLACVAAWQVAYVLLDGGPLRRARRRWVRVSAANLAVLGLASLTCAAARLTLDVPGSTLAAGCAMWVAGGTLAGLFDLGARRGLGLLSLPAGATALLLAAGLGCLLGALLLAVASLAQWPAGTQAELWLVVCGLNLVPGAVLAARCRLRPSVATGSRSTGGR